MTFGLPSPIKPRKQTTQDGMLSKRKHVETKKPAAIPAKNIVEELFSLTKPNTSNNIYMTDRAITN